MESKDLEKLGLTKNQSKVYYTLLKVGLCSITNLIKRAKLHKQIIYDNLEILIEKGLVSSIIKNNKRCFKAASPERLIDMFKEQKDEINEKEKLTKILLPELITLKENVKEENIASVYEGKKGIKSILESILKNKGEVLIYGAEGQFEETYGPYWINYNKRREDLKIKFKIIFNEKLRGKRDKFKFADIKFISKEFESPAMTCIFNNKVTIILWGDILFAVLIESKEVAKSYRNYFTMLWSIAKK